MSDTALSRREERRRRSVRHNPDGTMTLIEHLFELRRRLGWAVLTIVLGGILGFVWFAWAPFHIVTLGDLLKAPYCAIPAQPAGPRVQFGGGCSLLATAPFEIFLTRMEVGIAAGAVVTAPLWLYQIWAFITPGLYSKERKFALIFVAAASALFISGAVLAYFIVPQGLKILLGAGGDTFASALTGDKYISFVLNMLIIFGVSFELPLLVIMLNQIGMVSYDRLRRSRRGLIFGLFVFAAVATPGNDPFSMLALALALTALFELAIQITKIHDRRKAKREAEEEAELAASAAAEPIATAVSTAATAGTPRTAEPRRGDDRDAAGDSPHRDSAKPPYDDIT